MNNALHVRKLNLRGLVALMLAISGFGLPITGLVNHFYAQLPASVAGHAWMSAHNALGVLFVMFSVWHVVLNQRALLNYIRMTADGLPILGREALLACAIVILALVVSAGHAFHVN